MQKKGFKYCRKIIGIDGTHLRTITGGVLLTAVGIDSNDSIFPLCYAIVKKETIQSWTWFLEFMKTDLDITAWNEDEFTLISDKQKGLIQACKSILPKVEHRLCVRHLHGNMKVAGFQGKSLKDALWSCARAYTVTDFNRGFRHLKELDGNAFEWLADKHPKEWSRSHFSCASQSDMLVNNICECFNSVISEARQQPIIGCLENIRKLLMKKLYEKRETAKRWTQSICPMILDKLAVIEKQAASYRGTQSDYHLFEIQGMYGDQQEVDLQRKRCSCRKWDLTGIPCKHAVCAIWLKKGVVHDYIDKCYSRDTYLKIYEGSIHPMAGATHWPLTDRKPPLPPLYTARPGRPRKLRKRSADELTKNGVSVAKNQLTNDGLSVARSHIQLHCSICRKSGHNCRSCPDKTKRIHKQMKPRKRVIKPTSVPVDVPVHEDPVDVPIHEDPVDVPVHEDPVDVTVHEDPVDVTVRADEVDVPLEDPVYVPVYEEGINIGLFNIPVEPVTLNEQEIMTQEDLDFYNQFDFSTPFEDQPAPHQDQPVPAKDQHVPDEGCYGQSPKNKGKGKDSAKKQKHLKKRGIAGRTRASKTFKSVFFGNSDDPLTID